MMPVGNRPAIAPLRSDNDAAMKAFRFISLSVTAAAVLTFATLVSGTFGASRTARASSDQVIYDVTTVNTGLAFSPNKLVIPKGSLVRWTLTEGHNMVHDAQPVLFAAPEIVATGSKEYVFEFKSTGVYTYHCEPHAALGMIGVISVVEFKSVFLPLMTKR
jgi:plastocyanin